MDLKIEEARNPTIEGISDVADVFHSRQIQECIFREVRPVEQGSPTPGTTTSSWTVRNCVV